MTSHTIGDQAAERAAYDIVLVEFLNATHPDTDPNRRA